MSFRECISMFKWEKKNTQRRNLVSSGSFSCELNITFHYLLKHFNQEWQLFKKILHHIFKEDKLLNLHVYRKLTRQWLIKGNQYGDSILRIWKVSSIMSSDISLFIASNLIGIASKVSCLGKQKRHYSLVFQYNGIICKRKPKQSKIVRMGYFFTYSILSTCVFSFVSIPRTFHK